MVIASLLQRTGLVVLQMQSMNGRVRTWRTARAVRPRPLRGAVPSRHTETGAPGPFWDGDDGEPTWEDAEWQ